MGCPATRWVRCSVAPRWALESIFTGRNVAAEKIEAGEKSEKELTNLAGTITAIAETIGKPIDKVVLEGKGSAATWEEFNKIIAEVSPNMEKLGLTVEDVADMNLAANTEEGQKAWKEFLENLTTPGKATGMWDRLGGSGQAGRALLGSDQSKLAIKFQENAQYFFEGVDEIVGTMRKHGQTWRQIAVSAERGQAAVEDENSREYELLQAVSQKAQYSLQMQLPLMGRPQAFQAQTQMTGGIISALSQGPQTNENVQQRQEAMQQMDQQVLDQAMYYKQMIMQQRQFDLQRDQAWDNFNVSRSRMDEQYNLQRSRSQEAYDLQRKQQEEDYQLSRERANRDYDKQVDRAAEGYERSMKRAHQDFNRSRRQSEADYQHQQELMIKPSAMEMYDIYDRVSVQRTHSTGALLVNTQDQLQRMQQQEANLETLRRMGMTDESIQQLGLTKTENSQQLQRMVVEIQFNPELIAADERRGVSADGGRGCTSHRRVLRGVGGVHPSARPEHQARGQELPAPGRAVPQGLQHPDGPDGGRLPDVHV